MAANLEDPRDIFKQIKIQEINRKMSEPFSSQDSTNPNPKNPNLVVEKFNAHVHIISYRQADFGGLFDML